MSYELGLTNEQYHALPGASQSGVKLLLKDSDLFHGYETGKFERPGPTASMNWGTGFDSFTIGGTPLEIAPASVLTANGQKRGKKWDEYIAEREGVLVLTESEAQAYQYCVESIQQHELANDLIFGDGDDHPVIQWTDEETGIDCKCQLDRAVTYNGSPVIPDLKTSASVKPEDFVKSAYNFGYHVQAAVYSEAYRIEFGEEPDFVFVVVKNSPAYSVECYKLDEDFIELGLQTWRDGLRRLSECRESGDFRTASAKAGQLLQLTAPRYAVFNSEYEVTQ